MKPIRLELEGFGPYATAQVMDFRDLEGHDLVLIEGPTGAGKTTIFDAISYALYGHVPGARASVMSQLRSSHVETGADVTRVRFTFERGGHYYRVERKPEYARPKKRGEGTTKQPASAKLFRLYARSDGEERLFDERLVSAKTQEITALVTELVGLSAVQFNQVLVLPQGQFRDFLEAQSSRKEELLSALFGDSVHDQVCEALIAETKSLVREEERLAERLADRLQLADVERIEDLTAKVEGIERALPLVEEDVRDVRQRATTLARRLGAAEEAHARFTKQRSLSQELAELQKKWPQDLESKVEGWSLELGELQRRVSTLEQAAKVSAEQRSLTAQVQAAQARYQPLAENRKDNETQLQKLGEQLEVLLGEGEERSQLLEELRTQVAACRRKQDEHALAITLASTLRGSEPCPVCGSREHPAPAHGEQSSQLHSLERQLASAQKSLEASRQMYRTVRAEQSRLKKVAEEQLAAAERARQTVAEKRAQLEAVEAQMSRYESLREGSQGEGSQGDESPGDLETQWRTSRKRLEERESHVQRAQKAMRQMEALEASLRALLEVSTQHADEPLALRRQVRHCEGERKRWEAHQAELHASLASLWSIRDDVAAIERDLLRVQTELRIVKPLAAAVRGQNPRGISLSRYVLQAKMEEVAQAASARLLRMTEQRYRLKVGDERMRGRQSAGLDLFVVDAFSADAERPVQTLSGGEAFLASLALAMGLSDVVQAHAGGVRMDALFIDEGFGTLDAETLDLAMAAIRELRTEGRMIGIISHVEALKEVIPAHIQVRKRVGGSTIRMPKGQQRLAV